MEYIYAMRGVDFSLYRQATILRKLALRLQETKTNDYREYLTYLKTNPEELQTLLRTLTIKVSNFFRNPLVFELLHTTVLPELAAEFGFLKAWSIGCANGEEPYSLAMIAHELLTGEKISFVCHIQGTDVDSEAVEKARKGEYSDEALFETKRKYLEKYFTKSTYQPHSGYGHKHYIVTDEIKSMVKFSSDNVMNMLLYKKPYLGTYNLILCRNVMIYMNREMQEWIVRTLGDILSEKGYLVLGEAETMPESRRQEFEQPFPSAKIFRKRRSATTD
jgi:chemotaxis protein methyltransferase CheR